MRHFLSAEGERTVNTYRPSLMRKMRGMQCNGRAHKLGDWRNVGKEGGRECRADHQWNGNGINVFPH